MPPLPSRVARPLPALSASYTGRQLVDGNNYLLNRFRQDASGLVVRNILADIRACLNPPVFVFDGANGTARRRGLCPSYKQRSTTAIMTRESLWPTLELFKSMMPFVPCVTVCVPGWEADDVLATLALSSRAPCRVVTNDRDLCQLAVHPHVEVTADLEGVPPSLVRLYKTFVGDRSDNLPGVWSFGPKAWDRLNKQLAARLDFAAFNAEQLGLTQTQHRWCAAHEQVLRDAWEAVGLMDVPMVDIISHIKVGRSDVGTVERILREFLL